MKVGGKHKNKNKKGYKEMRDRKLLDIWKKEWSDEDKENELEELQIERLIFFLFKRINVIFMMLFNTFFQFMSDLVNLLSGQ